MTQSERMIREVQSGVMQGTMQAISLSTARGVIPCRFYPTAAPTQYGAIWVGGVGGNWDTPARGLYPRLCEELLADRIASLRINFRNPQNLPEAVFDVRAGVTYLREQGINQLALTGHSFGGAVVIQAAAAEPDVRTVVTLATQSYGVELVTQLASRCSILLLHGTNDPVLSPRCSQYTHSLAAEPKKLILYPGAGHGLDEVADAVHTVVGDWIPSQLRLNG